MQILDLMYIINRLHPIVLLLLREPKDPRRRMGVRLETVVLPDVATFQVGKQKDVLPPEVQEEVATVGTLPVPPKGIITQEDNLFLYYKYHYHCSSAVGELDVGCLPARLFFKGTALNLGIGTDINICPD